MMGADVAIEREERDSPRRAVGGQQPIERIPCPVERERMTDERHEGSLIDDESRIRLQRIRELGVLDRQPADLGQKGDL